LSLLKRNRHFEGTRRLQATCFTLISSLPYSSPLKTVATCSSETSVHFQQATQSYPRRQNSPQPQVRTSSSTYYILPRDGAAIDGFWTNDWIYWTFTLVTTYNYDCLTELHTQYHCNYSTHKIFSVVTSHCLAGASNDGRSPSSGFPSCPRPQLPASHFSQLQLSSDSTTQDKVKVIRVLRPTVSWPYCTLKSKIFNITKRTLQEQQSPSRRAECESRIIEKM
jgi:hypothetical protein